MDEIEWNDVSKSNKEFLQCWMERTGYNYGGERMFICQNMDESWKVIAWFPYDDNRIEFPLHTATDLDSAKRIAGALFKVWNSGREYV